MATKSLWIFGIALLSISSAEAAVFTQTATVNSSGQPDYTYASLDFAGFDPSLGTLNGITIQGQISVQERLTYQFASSTSSTVPVTLRFNLNAGNGPFVYTSVNTIGSAAYFPDGSEVVTVSGSAALTDILSSAFVATQLQGAGFSGQIGTSVTSPAFPTYLYGTVTAQATAFYDYTPVSVPEPSSMALLGLVTLLPLTRRRTDG